MRKIFLLCYLAVTGFAWAQDIPAPLSPPRLVNDFAGLFSANETALLEEKLRIYHDTTSTQLYVVTVSTLNGYDISQYASELGEKWKIGQKGKDNGAVLLIKPKSERESGEVFIATGYGLEGAIPDITAKRIIEDAILPHFRNNQFYQGVNAGIDRMIAALAGEYQADNQESNDFIPPWVIILLIILFIRLTSKNKNKPNNGGNSTSTSGRPIFFPPTGRGFGGGFSGGGRGFGGGGGGRFGGGGAGGRW